jgi:NAD(P)-dependent dehydrogenase (short-subunit alcohol dehydrogenase family)
MSASISFDGRVAVVTGASGALGSAVATAFDQADATVCGIDLVEPTSEDALLEPGLVDFYAGDLTNEDEVADIVEAIVEAHDWDVAVTDGRAGGARFEVTGVGRPSH